MGLRFEVLQFRWNGGMSAFNMGSGKASHLDVGVVTLASEP